MSRQRFFVILGAAVLLLLFLCGWIVFSWPPSEPVFEGVGAIEWYERVQRPGRDALRKDEIFQGLGPEAILCLLVHHDSTVSPWPRRYLDFWRRCPQWVRDRLPVPSFRISNTFALRDVFAAIGPAAVPELMELASSRTKEWRIVGFDTLTRIRFRGYPCREALPLFLESLTDPDPDIQRVVGAGLRFFGEDAVGAVPELRQMLMTARRLPQAVPRWQMERVAILALGGIGPGAADAVPELLSVVYQTNAVMGLEAVKALRRMQVTPTNLVATLRPRWPAMSMRDRGYAVKMLDEVSSDEARKGVDLLVKGLSLPAQRDRLNATNVLRRIAPKVFHELHETTRTN